MNKEPIGLYIFRFIVGFGLFAFMAMLYWSSLLLEEDMRNLRLDLAGINENIQELTDENIKIKNILETRSYSKDQSQPGEENSQKKNNLGVLNQRKQIDATLPNLLAEDPFYLKVLPGLLGKDFKPHGTFHQATIGRPDNLHPFSEWGTVQEWVGMCTVTVARLKFGIYETFAPNMAIKVESRVNKDNQQEYWIHLRDNVYWQPLQANLFPADMKLAPHFLKKHKVTAEDFKFYFDAVMNPKAGKASFRTYIQDIEEFRVIDPLTFAVRWKTEEIKQPDGSTKLKTKYSSKFITGGLLPLASFVYKYFSDGTKIIEDDNDPETYRKSIIWAQNFAQHWAQNIIPSCGAWIFDGMNEQSIKFRRNPDHFFPLDVLFEKRETAFREEGSSIWQQFKLNKMESYALAPEQFAEYNTFIKSPQYKQQESEGAAIKRLDYVDPFYTFIGWNEAKPYFKSKKVRKALTMAIDRQRIIRQNLNGLGLEINGTFYIYSDAYDKSIKPLPYDPRKARALLAEEGWYDSDGDGIIDKEIDGKRVPFKFSLTYYIKNDTAKGIVEYISTTLKEIGISCELNGVDITDLSVKFKDQSFDAVMISWSLGTPPEDPKQIWYSNKNKESGSSNVIGFSNAEVDAIIDQLEFEDDKKKRTELYHRFDQILHEEQPYTFLFTPKRVLLYREKLQNVFLPVDRKDLVPDANIASPDSGIFWIKD